jgi:malic enzyme
MTYRSPIAPVSPNPCSPSRPTPKPAYRYTNKGNLIGIVTDGSAILGLGNLGPLAVSP